MDKELKMSLIIGVATTFAATLAAYYLTKALEKKEDPQLKN